MVFAKKCALLLPLSLAICCSAFCAGLSAKSIKTAALAKDTVQESVEFIYTQLDQCATPSDLRSILFFLGTLEEHLGQYQNASASYARAAGIAASDAEGMSKANSEQLVLCAIRASLHCGDYETADTYLNSAVRSSQNETVLAYVNLYSVWSSLCRAKSMEDTSDTLSLLKAYASMTSMKVVRPSILFTLWYLTDQKSYAETLQKEYPKSPEAGIVQGTVQIMSVPFWYFVPRVAHAEGESVVYAAPVSTATQDSASTEELKRQQLGLFKNKDNAEALILKLKEKGFKAYSFAETRASGTTYHIVVVDDTDGTMGTRLRNAGFESYPIK